MKKIMITLAASLTVLLAACTKNERGKIPESLLTESNLLALKSIPANPAANPQNPYDFMGYYHNLALDSLRHYVKTTGDTTRQGKYGYINRYFKNNFGADVRLSYNPKEKLACTDYRTLWFNQKISASAMVYWHSLSDAVQGIKDLNHFDALKQQIVAIESKVSADKLAADEKKNLLIASAILRYSGYYWINAFRSGDVVYHEGGSSLSMPDSFLRKIAGVITGICADASVVAAGYITGDYSMIGEAELWSEVCGYYTGWW